MRTNCLWYALDRWVEEGGCLGLVRSTHWCIPHVNHRAIGAASVTQFVPFHDLKEPWYSLFGFDGQVVYGDADAVRRGPMNPVCMFLGTCILFVSGAVWVATRAAQQLLRPIP